MNSASRTYLKRVRFDDVKHRAKNKGRIIRSGIRQNSRQHGILANSTTTAISVDAKQQKKPALAGFECVVTPEAILIPLSSLLQQNHFR